MRYVTSIERIARAEAKLAGQIQLLQELLVQRVMSDEEFEQMSQQQLAELQVSLRQQLDAR